MLRIVVVFYLDIKHSMLVLKSKGHKTQHKITTQKFRASSVSTLQMISLDKLKIFSAPASRKKKTQEDGKFASPFPESAYFKVSRWNILWHVGRESEKGFAIGEKKISVFLSKWFASTFIALNWFLSSSFLFLNFTWPTLFRSAKPDRKML